MINHSGGASGSDITWENEGLEYGVDTIAYSFQGHNQKSKNQKILTPEELEIGWENIKIADKSLHRGLNRTEYIKNLLSRNYYQVKNSDCIFAIGYIASDNKVKGGTGWAVQMAIDVGKPVYIFDQTENHWFIYLAPKFVKYYDVPKLTGNFAGIGTRQITEDGINAIKEIYSVNFSEIT